jgi:hypothetical protein
MAMLRSWAGYVAGIGLITLALCKVLPTGVATVGFVLGLALLVVSALMNLRRSATGSSGSSGVGTPPGTYVTDRGAPGHHHGHGAHGGFVGHGGFGGHGGGHGG